MTNTFNKREIRAANHNDVAGILAILEQNLLSKKTIAKELLEQIGFLVKSFTADELKNGISDSKNNIILVATEGNEIVGYAWSYDLHAVKPEWLSAVRYSTDVKPIIESEKVLYHKHIGVKLETKGVGTQLLTYLIDKAMQLRYSYILCQIVEQPLKNIASTVIHEKFDFLHIGLLTENNFILGIYLKKLNQG